jgi:hypothetical protein
MTDFAALRYADSQANRNDGLFAGRLSAAESTLRDEQTGGRQRAQHGGA